MNPQSLFISHSIRAPVSTLGSAVWWISFHVSAIATNTSSSLHSALLPTESITGLCLAPPRSLPISLTRLYEDERRWTTVARKSWALTIQLRLDIAALRPTK
jgi:hypothetical protein